MSIMSISDYSLPPSRCTFSRQRWVKPHGMCDCLSNIFLHFKHLVTNVYRVVDAFFALWEGRGDPITYFNDTRSATYLLESTAYLLQTLIGDSCLVSGYGMNLDARTDSDYIKIFRCFIVWERNIWVVLLPLVLLVSCAGCIYVHVYLAPL